MIRVASGARAIIAEDIGVAVLQDCVKLSALQRHKVTFLSAEHFLNLQRGDDTINVLHATRVSEVLPGSLEFLIKAGHERDVVDIASLQSGPCREIIFGDTSHQLLG